MNFFQPIRWDPRNESCFQMTNQKHRNKHIDWTANQITAFISSSQFITYLHFLQKAWKMKLEFLSGNLKTRNFFFPIKMHPFASSLFFFWKFEKKGSASTRIRTPDLPLYSSLSMPQDHEIRLWNMGKSCIHDLVK